MGALLATAGLCAALALGGCAAAEPATSVGDGEGDEAGSILVVNAWGSEGVAGKARDRLEAAGLQGIDVDNAAMIDYPVSTVLYDDGADRAVADQVAEELGIESVEPLHEGTTWGAEHDVVVVIGSDFYGRLD